MGWAKVDPVFLAEKYMGFTGVLFKKMAYGGVKTKTSSTVDGRNPVDHLGCMKPGKYDSPYQLVQDCFPSTVSLVFGPIFLNLGESNFGTHEQ